MARKSKTQNQKGQSLIEYLIIVALLGVATISVVKVLQATLQYNMAQIISALQGEKPNQKLRKPQLKKINTKKKDFSDFMRDSANSFNSESGR